VVRVATPRTGSPAFALAIGLAAACALVLRRWTTIVDPRPLEVDESAMVARALKATLDPVPWRSYDGTTSGPLDTLALVLPRVLGLPIGYFEARVLAVLLIVVTLGAWYATLARLLGPRAALAGTLGPFLFFALTDHLELTTFASELVPLALLSVAGFAIACAREGEEDASLRRLALGAFLAGAAPWAKLQTAPIALVLIGLALGIAWTRVTGARSARDRYGRAFAVLGVASLPTVGFALLAASTGTLADLSISYILQSRAYVQPAQISPIEFFFVTPWTGPWYVGIAATIAALSIVVAPTLAAAARRVPRVRRCLAVSAVFAVVTLASVMAVIAPQRAYEHYLLLPLLPSSGLAAALAAAAAAAFESLGRARASRAISAFALVAPALGPLWSLLAEPNPARWALPDRGALRDEALADVLRCARKPGETVAIWGFAPDAYVAAGAAPATRDAIAQFQIDPGPYRPYYRARFLADLTYAQPGVVVEAIGPSAFLYHDRATQGIASFPDLERYVAARYPQRLDLGDAIVFVRAGTNVSGRCTSPNGAR
jgi:hypothetical protein